MARVKEGGEKRSAVIDNIVIRHCSSEVAHPSPLREGAIEMQMCVELQREVWGFSDVELVPLRIFVVAEKIGGQVIGAFDGDEMVGFAMAIPGVRDARPYLHSHMLAVREGYRDKGLGRKLKLFQRDDALARGIELMEWTFDPLEIKNAYLNLEKLGAIARRYVVNQYGITHSPLQGGLPTDRLVAEWWLKSKRVESAISASAAPFPKGEGANPSTRPKIKMSVEIPAEVYEWKKSPEMRGKALEVQTRVREQLMKAFGDGLACLGYERDGRGNGKFLVGKWQEMSFRE